jgi:hypothetical protein
VLLAALAFTACGGDDEDDAAPPIAVLGDSLTYAAAPYLEQIAAGAGRSVAVTGVPGAALCDLRDDIERLLRDAPPASLVMVFAGNNATSCAGGRTGQALADLYAADARAIVELARARDVPVVLAGPPAIEPSPWAENAVLLDDAFRAIADEEDGVEALDLWETLSPDGFTQTLPCLESEGEAQGCVDGKIAVRDDDGVHFDDPGPDGYSSGAYRFARAVFDAGEAAA